MVALEPAPEDVGVAVAVSELVDDDVPVGSLLDELEELEEDWFVPAVVPKPGLHVSQLC